MRKYILPLIATMVVTMLGPSSGLAQDVQPVKSMMFNAIEVAKIRQAQADFERQARGGNVVDESDNNRTSTVPNVYLSGFLDFGDGQWTVFANGYRITPRHQPSGITVVSVRNNAVEFVVAGEQPSHFRLYPYQTWRSGRKDVVEGIIP